MAEKTNITKDTPPEMIEQDIARTRQEMGETVSAIQEKLSPTHMKEEAKGRIREKVRYTKSRIGQTAKDTGSNIANTLRSNPVPIAMISVGIAWLAYGRSHDGYGRFSERGTMVKEKAGELSERAQSKFGEVSGQVREAGSEYAYRARETASRAGMAAKERAYGAKNSVQQLVHNNPLGITLAAFAIGALAGFSIPESMKEKEVMGTASDSLIEKARGTAQKTIQKAQQAAEKAVETAQAEFKKTA